VQNDAAAAPPAAAKRIKTASSDSDALDSERNPVVSDRSESLPVVLVRALSYKLRLGLDLFDLKVVEWVAVGSCAAEAAE
jgi:hypothetical protein